MFWSGMLAERMDLRYFLTLGMLLSGFFTFMFGFAKYYDIHSLYYFITVQVRMLGVMIEFNTFDYYICR